MGKFRRKVQQIQQGELWIPAAKLTSGPKDHFYARLQKVLDGMDFTGQVHRICEPYYKAGGRSAGRPPIDPAVFFKMMMVGFLEGIPSDRGVAARFSDSLTLRRFLGYSLTEETPDHSSFTIFRQRLPQEAFTAAHKVVLEGLRAHGLLKGRHLGIDSSDMEANASLRGLVKRNTEESYRDYVRELARAAGVDAEDPAAVARFDRRRKGRKTSNAEWSNPHDPDAKVGRTKQGACDMLHKPEHMVDLDSGAIVAAEVRPGDAADSRDISTRVIEAAELVEDLHGGASEQGASHVRSVTTDKGFHDPAELAILQHELGVRTVNGDAHGPRRKLERLEPESRAAVRKAARAVASQSGRELLRKRGEKIERSFAHVLDSGGQRRTTLRGLANTNKRYLCAIIGFNLGLILRRLTGVGTPRQAAAVKAAFLALCRWLLDHLTGLWRPAATGFRPSLAIFQGSDGSPLKFSGFYFGGGKALSSTGS